VVVISDNVMRFPRSLIGALDSAAVTLVELVPTVVGWLVDEVTRAGGHQLADLRYLFSTGEELRPALAARTLAALPHVTIINAYGPAECSDDVTLHIVTSADVERARLPVGRPIINTALYLLVHEPDGRWRPAGQDETGELFIGGAGVGLGYLNDPVTTAGAFFRDPFDPASPTGRIYRTGDLARFGEGLVHYLGRSDRQVKVAGVRMELDEIEVSLSRHGAVTQCAVIVAADRSGFEVLTAHYAVREPTTSEELQAHLAAVLPATMIPHRWLRWDTLPLTANGKVDHQALRAASHPIQENIR
jgi:non-ribosomal peptide synthetase component F